MTVQRKKLIDDTGSAVVAECVSQLNRAAGYAALVPLDFANGAGGTETAFITFVEDVYVTNLVLGLNGQGDLDNAADDIFVKSNVSPDGSGGTTLIAAEGFNGAALTNNESYQMSTIVSGADSGSGAFPLRFAAGDTLAVQIVVNASSAFVNGGDGMVNGITVSYRPVKDELTLQPNVPNKLKNWSSTDR